MFCVNCGNKLMDQMKFCPVCGTKTVSNQSPNTQGSFQMDKSVKKVRRILSQRPIVEKNRSNWEFDDPEIDDLIDNHGLGFEVLMPDELNEAIKNTPFDNEEDLASILYRYSSLWDYEELQQASVVFAEDQGYHAAVGLYFSNGKHKNIPRDLGKAIEHLQQAPDLPMSLNMLLGIYGQLKDFVNLRKYAQLGLHMDVPAAYYYQGMLHLGGVAGVEENREMAMKYIREAVEKAWGQERTIYIDIYNDLL